VKTLVAVLAPHKGQAYDPCCGSGGMCVQPERFRRLAAMNLAIRGIDFNLGKEPAVPAS